MTYLRTHWRGEQPFAWSFWINLVLLRVAAFSLEGLLTPIFAEHPRILVVATVGFFLLFHVALYIWQIVGVLRAGDRYLQSYGSSIWVPAAHVGVIASFILTSVSGFAASQNLFVDKPDRNLAEAWQRERAARYTLTVTDDGRYIRLTGQFELGVTRGLTTLLSEHPDVRGIILNSEGGYISEGRGVARLIRNKGLDTYVFDVCKSACTTAFMGGKNRAIGENGRLGFHQYWVAVNYPEKLLSPQVEQDKDRSFFAEQGIHPRFLTQIFDKPHSDIWFPGREELLQAGVVQRIIVAENPYGSSSAEQQLPTE